jgi:Transposase DDE domain
VRADLDALLTAIYVLVDDFLPGRQGPGAPPRISDAELIALAIAQVFLGLPNDRQFLALARCRLGHLFPYLPKQPGYSKRIKAAGPLIAKVVECLAAEVSATCDEFRFIDATPIPCGASVSTRKRSQLAGIAGYGYCASHSRWYWGVKLYLVTTAHGMPIGWCLANPKLGEREVAIELIGDLDDAGMLPGQCVLIGDKGFAGTDFQTQAALHNVFFVRPDRRNDKHRFGNLGGIRQLIESVFDTGKGQLSLEAHGARTTESLYARTAQRLLALAAAIWHNRNTAAPTARSLIAYDH